MDKKLNVKIRDNAHIYIHNDLTNAASYFKQRIEERSKKGDRQGIGLEMMACLIMTAFAFEANINFLGFKLIADWDEWRPTSDKLEIVARKLKHEVNFESRPYATVKELKTFRDTLAHGKPVEIRGEKQLVITREELERRDILKADWEQYLNEEFVSRSYDDVESIWKALFESSGLTIVDTLTSGGSNIQIVESVDN